uniref:Uncharacterized protein n=1 Tax=Odontella aurita TaxID=265563 RepID=A0A7S4JIB8_9STRA
MRGDNVGLLPIHVYILRNKNPEAIQVLLEGMFCHRVQRVGLDLWKRDLDLLLDSLTTYERDMVARDKLDAISEEIKALEERAFLLELVTWKASCLPFSGCFESMADIAELAAKDASFDHRGYKDEKRVKCGAEVIVPGVLSFLEDERVIELVNELV